jgi:hypothetical protein
MSARTSEFDASCSCRASWRSSWSPRARWPSASAPAGAGIPAFYTPTGVGTPDRRGQGDARPSTGEPTSDGDARCTADFALVKAWKGDRHGNLVFRKHRAQLQPHDGHGRPRHHRRGRRAGRARRARPRRRSTPPGSSSSASSRAPTTRSGSRSARRTTQPYEPRWTLIISTWLDRDQMARRVARKSSRTATTSTSASGCRPGGQPHPGGRQHRAPLRERPAGHGALPRMRGTRGRRPDQRRQGDRDR